MFLDYMTYAMSVMDTMGSSKDSLKALFQASNDNKDYVAWAPEGCDLSSQNIPSNEPDPFAFMLQAGAPQP
jgi:hypothetical protein